MHDIQITYTTYELHTNCIYSILSSTYDLHVKHIIYIWFTYATYPSESTYYLHMQHTIYIWFIYAPYNDITIYIWNTWIPYNLHSCHIWTRLESFDTNLAAISLTSSRRNPKYRLAINWKKVQRTTECDLHSSSMTTLLLFGIAAPCKQNYL